MGHIACCTFHLSFKVTMTNFHFLLILATPFDKSDMTPARSVVKIVVKGELRSISTCSFIARATVDLPVPKTQTHLVQPLQGSLNRELALTANSMGAECYTVF